MPADKVSHTNVFVLASLITFPGVALAGYAKMSKVCSKNQMESNHLKTSKILFTSTNNMGLPHIEAIFSNLSDPIFKRPTRDACLCMRELPAPPAPHFVFLITL